MENLIKRGFIPFDKSWIIRMAVLDLINNYDDSTKFLKENYEKLSDDLKSLYNSLIQWNSEKPINVGESGTLYRFLKFASWKTGKNKEFILEGTLKNRKICDNPLIINLPLKKLLTLDNKTSQWASASVLMGNSEKIPNPPYKLQLTYNSVEHWKNARKNKKIWEPKYDKTILVQAQTYLKFLETGQMQFNPKQAEDYCFARAFNIINAKQGKEKWPSLIGHETNRITEMENFLDKDELTSKDHRVVQAIAMLKKGKIKIKHPDLSSYP